MNLHIQPHWLYVVLCILVPMNISLLLVPPVKKLAWRYGIFAVENNRTVHHGKIPRIGGIAVYIAFMIGCLLFLPQDEHFKGILAGGTVVFIGGLLDDIVNLRPRYKLMFQSAGALIAMFVGGIELTTIRLPFGLSIPPSWFSYVITFLWMIGITNAINLLDGLDGLSSGFSIIVLASLALLSTTVRRPEISAISTILIGAIGGFLPYNFHPASIFIGDCGAQFLGFTIASISILGFKSGTFITMLIPIILLFIPIMDTLSAMLRRTLEHHSVMEADKNHLHHVLMRHWGLGQTETVLIIYAMTAMFGFTAYMCAIDEPVGVAMLIVLVLAFDILIEVTGMVSPKYHPILSLINKIKSTEHKLAQGITPENFDHNEQNAEKSTEKKEK